MDSDNKLKFVERRLKADVQCGQDSLNKKTKIKKSPKYTKSSEYTSITLSLSLSL